MHPIPGQTRIRRKTVNKTGHKRFKEVTRNEGKDLLNNDSPNLYLPLLRSGNEGMNQTALLNTLSYMFRLLPEYSKPDLTLTHLTIISALQLLTNVGRKRSEVSEARVFAHIKTSQYGKSLTRIYFKQIARAGYISYNGKYLSLTITGSTLLNDVYERFIKCLQRIPMRDNSN